jgi:hypothetical protein
MCNPGKCGVLSLRSEFLFDETMQMITDCRVIQPFDHFIEEGGDKKALGDFCRDAAGAQIKQLVFFNLTGSGTVGATDVVGENFQARHRVRFGVVAQEKIANFLIRVREMRVRFHADQPAEDGAGAIVQRVFVKQVARRAWRDVVLQCARVEFLLVFRHRDSEQIATATFADESAQAFESRILCAYVQIQAHR